MTREWLLTEAERALQQSVATKEAVQSQLDEVRATLKRLASAEETFKDLSDQLKTLQARVKSCEEDLRSALGDTTQAATAQRVRPIGAAGQSVGTFPCACAAVSGLL